MGFIFKNHRDFSFLVSIRSECPISDVFERL
jgi:hypothetical protein